MLLSIYYGILLVLPGLAFSLEKGNPCITPNGENATCIPLSSCTTAQISSLNNSITEFILESACGNLNDELLICCGSTNFPISVHAGPLKHKLLPDTCGFHDTNRIYLGAKTQFTQYPWIALLGYRNTNNNQFSGFKCGGTIINSKYVLTAAHCIGPKSANGLELEKVRLGEWQISTYLDCEDILEDIICADPVVDVKVEKAIPHPNYSKGNGDNDIALIRLENNVQFTDFIAPICLPPFQSPVLNEHSPLEISGWGSNDNNSATSDEKLRSLLRLVSHDKCKEEIGNRTLVSYRQICAAGNFKTDSTCRGDSGGPLMADFRSFGGGGEQWYQVGVISWDTRCEPTRPGVFTRVSKHLNWILDNISES